MNVAAEGPKDKGLAPLFDLVLKHVPLAKTEPGAFRMIGDGSILYHMTYIDDLVNGIILCGEHPAAIGQTYILCGPRYTTLTELAAAVAAAVGRPAPKGHIPVWPVMLAARACEAICRPMGIEPPLHRRRLDFFLKDRGFSGAASFSISPRFRGQFWLQLVGPRLPLGTTGRRLGSTPAARR